MLCYYFYLQYIHMSYNTIVEKINNASLDDIKNWLASQDDIGILGDDPSSCWASCAYFYGKEPTFENKMILDDIINIKNGIYFMSLNCNYEFHNFVLSVDNDIFKIIQTYGGFHKLSKLTYSKPDFIELITNIFNGDGKAWKTIFNIPDRYNFPEIIKNIQLFME